MHLSRLFWRRHLAIFWVVSPWYVLYFTLVFDPAALNYFLGGVIAVWENVLQGPSVVW